MKAVETCIESLKNLPDDLVEEAANYIETLHEKHKEERTKALDTIFGTLSEERANEWLKTVKEDCCRL